MDVDAAIKESIKANRLADLQRRYYNLQLDVTALEAVGDMARAEEIKKIMDNIQMAYDAIAGTNATDMGGKRHGVHSS